MDYNNELADGTALWLQFPSELWKMQQQSLKFQKSSLFFCKEVFNDYFISFRLYRW